MYIRVYDEQRCPLVIVSTSDFGDWLEETDYGIIDFETAEDICTAIVGPCND